MHTVRSFGLACLVLVAACGSESSPPPPPPPPPPVAPTPATPAPEPVATETPTPIVPDEPAPPTTPDVLGPNVVPPPARRLALTTGGGCAIGDSGRVWCWGQAVRDDIDEDPSVAPALQETVTAAAHVDMNESVACAVTPDTRPICWGEGPLVPPADWGDGADDEYEPDTPPISYEDVDHAIHADVGMDDACLVRRDGSVFCAGAHSYGVIQGIESVVEISIGYAHLCARRADGHVFCWGDNGDGQLGDDVGASSDSPVEVPNVTDATRLVSGDVFTCALRQTGNVSCWGAPVAVISEDEQTSPHDVPGISDAVDLFAGPTSACVRRAEGDVLCWGDNGFGVVGDGTTIDRALPTPIPALRGATEIALHDEHACARLADGSFVCWGRGRDGGALGPRGARTSYGVVQAIAPSTDRAPTGLMLFAQGSCARFGDSLSCWGRVPRSEQPGLVDRARPSQVAFGGPSLASIRGTSSRTCAIERPGTMRCGTDAPLAGRAISIELPSVVDLSVGGSSACALMLDHTLRCFRLSSGGRGFASSETPTPVETPPALSVAVGSDALACIVTDAHRVHCFGDRVPGVQRAETEGGPVVQEGLENVVQIAATATSVCAIGGDEHVRCVGDTWRTPVDLGLTRVRELVAGSAHYCARVVTDTGGEVHCWGNDANGQLARAPRDVVGGSSSTPLRIDGLAEGFVAPPIVEGTPAPDASTLGIVELAASLDHTCARRSDGAVYCWGRDEEGEIGAVPGSLHLTPVQLTGIR